MKNNDLLLFGGILQPLIESLQRNTGQKDKLLGKEVVIPQKNFKAIIALEFNGNIHLLVSPPPEDDSRLSRLDLKGLKISNKKWSVSGNPARVYLDLSCETATFPLFKRPFLRFAEDVLYEVSKTDNLPSEALYKTCLRWKKFWSPETVTEVSKEWVYGLFGELLFLTELLKRFGPSVITSWSGPTGSDHDFQKTNDIAVEIKTSTELPFKINCNLNQLDPDIFKNLFLACYHLIPSETGTTLPELVRSIEKLVRDGETALEKFYKLLSDTGYKLQNEIIYSEFKLDHNESVLFRIDSKFPKIVEKSFKDPPDHRISGIRYTLQLTGLEELTIDKIATHLKIFAIK